MLTSRRKPSGGWKTTRFAANRLGNGTESLSRTIVSTRNHDAMSCYALVMVTSKVRQSWGSEVSRHNYSLNLGCLTLLSVSCSSLFSLLSFFFPSLFSFLIFLFYFIFSLFSFLFPPFSFCFSFVSLAVFLSFFLSVSLSLSLVVFLLLLFLCFLCLSLSFSHLTKVR